MRIEPNNKIFMPKIHNQKLYQLVIYLLLFALSVIMVSCSLDIPLEDQVSDPDAVTTVVAAEKLLASAYKSYNSYNNTLEFTLMSDDFQPTNLLKEDVNLKWAYTWNEYAIIPLAKAEWNGNYTTIMRCNALLARLPNVNTATNEEVTQLQQIKNRALRLKAICYYRLLRVFSPAVNNGKNSKALGIIIKDKVEKTNKGRVSVEESVNYIEQILKQTNASVSTNTDTWMSANAAEYLKTELAMWAGDYNKVIATAKPLYDKLNEADFSAVQFSNLWNNMTSSARIFAKDISDRTGEYFYHTLLSDNQEDDYAVINSKIVYENTDIRYNIYNTPATMYVNSTEPNKKIMRFGKYCRLNRGKTPSSKFEIYRAAGLVFLLVEAYAQQEKLSEAITVLNKFLFARKANPVDVNLTKEQLLTVILSEKQKEFVGEGERFFDLKRIPQALQRYSTFDKKLLQIASNDYRWVFPIPAEEIRYNTACKQNKGWEHVK